MNVLRDAAERLIDVMRDSDRFGLITFSDVAQRDLPLVTLANGRRTQARSAIRALRPDASTNLQDGLQMSIAQFDAGSGSSRAQRRNHKALEPDAVREVDR